MILRTYTCAAPTIDNNSINIPQNECQFTSSHYWTIVLIIQTLWLGVLKDGNYEMSPPQKLLYLI